LNTSAARPLVEVPPHIGNPLDREHRRVRLGGSKYQRTEKPGALVKRVRRGGGQHDPERLPGEDDAAHWTRFSRLNRERIEELERISAERKSGRPARR